MQEQRPPSTVAKDGHDAVGTRVWRRQWRPVNGPVKETVEETTGKEIGPAKEGSRQPPMNAFLGGDEGW